MATKCGRFVFEPHSAVLAAQLTSTLAREHGLMQWSSGAAYLTGDALVNDLALDAFEVLDVLPLDRKRLKTYLREHGIGRVEIKQRGVDVEPERLRREIAASGNLAATILVSPIADRIQAIVARRVHESSGEIAQR
jgi:hypothetical protein